jgi:hypothetical protein
MKTLKLASHIAKIESKKREVTIGNIREILSIISDVFYIEQDFPANIQTYTELLNNGRKRASRKRRKK